jgi:glycosyltransferase involved in cell wall biosynthesis
MNSLTVVIPAYNEAPTVGEAVARLRDTPPPIGPAGPLARNIVVVDDGSTDGTAAIILGLAERWTDLTVIRHPRNMGKGAALRTGFAQATGDIVLIHDADLEYDPRDHADLLRPIIEGRADAVIGSRFRGGTEHRVLYYWHSVANGLITTACNMATNLNLSDIECCSKAFRKEVLAGIQISENGFGVEPELIAKLSHLELAGQPLRIFEVPVSYAGRTYAQGKKIRWTDGAHALWCIARYGPLNRT